MIVLNTECIRDRQRTIQATDNETSVPFIGWSRCNQVTTGATFQMTPANSAYVNTQAYIYIQWQFIIDYVNVYVILFYQC